MQLEISAYPHVVFASKRKNASKAASNKDLKIEEWHVKSTLLLRQYISNTQMKRAIGVCLRGSGAGHWRDPLTGTLGTADRNCGKKTSPRV
ncbi:hypothetical protein [Pandoraea communis]|uniref:hypothetical protein n=1 Tax=Pandoraea communis TaxID=2508297 RepID=UPI001240A3F9|nr:hypothetical protein [Pandoraea communis]